MTTRSKGFGYHGYPFDFWRYEVNDLDVIFSDLSIEANEKDPSEPGVFLKARKPVSFTENNLKVYELFSIITLRHCKSISEFDFLIFDIHNFGAKIAVRRFISRILPTRVRETIKKLILKK